MPIPTQITRRQLLWSLGAGAGATAILGTSACGGTNAGSSDTIRLRLSHQWPKASDESGDFRARLAQKFAQRVARQTEGQVEIQIHPNASLVEPTEQHNAMTQGTIDMSVFPVVYATGQHPAFGITELPGLIQNHAQAQNWQKSEIGNRLEQIFEQSGSKILVWNWNSFCMAVRQGDPVTFPDDIGQGEVWRGGGQQVERMLRRGGASITSMDSSEIYSALQTGVLDALATSPASFRSYRLYEQTSSYTSPTENTIGFYFEPLLIGLEQFEQLPDNVRNVFNEASSELQDFAYQASEEDDLVTERAVEEAGNTIDTIDQGALAEWQELAKPVWDRFGGQVQNGQELIQMGLDVPAE